VDITAPQLQKGCTKSDVRFFADVRGCTIFWWFMGGRAQRFFRLLRAEAARLVLKLRAASCWGAAGCPPADKDKWAEGTKGGGGGHATRCGDDRARVVLCIKSKLAIGWPP
jgi:hypothetical protein